MNRWRRTLERLPWPLRPRTASETWRQGIVRAAANLVLPVLLAALVGAMVVASGVVPIKASSGHWPITAWFLNFSMQRSVSTHALPLEPPPLDEERLILLGAGHFETGCQPCHGRPGQTVGPIAAAMTPTPPRLSEAVANWDDEELFYIVKHGVKFTGMPAWPTQHRDDEVWAVSAFLRTLPTVDAEKYQRLVHGSEGEEPTTSDDITSLTDHEGPPLVQQCVRCHGSAGVGRGVGAFPKLAGQHAPYLRQALAAYRDEERPSGVMTPLAHALSDPEIAAIADYYAGLEPGVTTAPSPAAPSVAAGARLAAEGLPDKEVPACIGCHGPSEKPRNPNYPKLAGQHADYLEQQLKLFRQGVRGGGQYVHLMEDVAKHLSDEQIKALASYYSEER